jgi:hypothetical protein
MTNSGTETLYRERLLPGLSFYLATMFVPIALYLVALAFSGDFALAALIISELAIILLSFVFAPVIYLSQQDLRVGTAVIPVAELGEAFVIEGAEGFQERGQKLNPRAYIKFQIGVRGLAKVEIQDPNDPTPYWLFSTRKPEQLVAALKKLTS